MSELPKGWTTSKFTEVLDISGGTQPPKSEFIPAPQDGYIRLLQIRDFGEKPVPTFIPDNGKRKTCRKDDVLIGRYGASIGRICTGMEGAYNVALAKVIKPDFIDGGFLKYYLMSENFQQPLRLLSRSAQNGFNKKDLSNFDILYPPLEVQKRIADKLDSVLAKVEAAQARLDKIPAILKRFRQSVLAAATSGELTKDWRDGYEGKSSKDEIIDLVSRKSSQGFKIKKAQPALKISFPSLPEYWTYDDITPFLDVSRAGMKTGPFGSLLKKSDYVESGIPVVGIENIDLNGFQFGSKNHITPSKREELAGYNLMPGDIIISRSGTVGETCVIPEGIGKSIFSTNIMRLSFFNSSLNPFFFRHLFLGSDIVLKQVKELCKGSTRLFLNQKILSSIRYPIPPRAEQDEIVLRVEELLERAIAVEKQYIAAKTSLDKLTQSILAKAFRGELISNDTVQIDNEINQSTVEVSL